MARATCPFFANGLLLSGLLLSGLLLSGCGQSTAPTDEAPQGIAYGDYIIGEGVCYQNLTIFPVSSPEPRTDDRFITLDEGLKDGTVEIRELGGAQPNANGQPAVPAPNAGGAANAPVESPPQGGDRAQPPPRRPPPAGAARQTARPGGQQAGEAPSAEPQQTAQSPAEPGSASVNQVLVVNRSTKPLYLTPGDIMLGGQQDRVIGQEFVVEADGKPATVPVFCVEHGRWARRDVSANVGYLEVVQSRDSEKLSAEELKKLAEEANEGKFVKGAGVVTKDVRLAVQAAQGNRDSQPKVWDEVAKANGKNGAQSGSGAFTANYGEKEIAEKLDPYLEGLQAPVAESRQVIGVIVAINGKPHSIDVFESTPLFQKLWPKLLKSYALDALGHSQEAEAEKTCDAAAAAEFLKQAAEAKVAAQSEKAGVSLTHRENNAVACFTVCKPAYEGQAAGEAAKTAPIHLNALSK